MSDTLDYRLKIEKYLPETLPFNLLREYLADLADLLGQEPNLHLMGMARESAAPVIRVDEEAEGKISERLAEIKTGDGDAKAMAAIQRIDARVGRANTTAVLISPRGARILEFQGAKQQKDLEWPTVVRNGELYGTPIWIGGSKKWKYVTLEDRDEEFHCKTDQNTATELLPHMWTKKLRATGTGKWRRSDDGWKLTEFKIAEFEIIAATTFDETIRKLQGIDGKWKKLDDPLDLLKKIRSGEE
jgi:hypothetical protein